MLSPKIVEYGLLILIGVVIGYGLKTLVDLIRAKGKDTYHGDFLKELVAMVTIVVFMAASFKSLFDTSYTVPWEVPVLFGAVMSFVYGKENPILSFLANKLTIKKDETKSSQ